MEKLVLLTQLKKAIKDYNSIIEEKLNSEYNVTAYYDEKKEEIVEEIK